MKVLPTRLPRQIDRDMEIASERTIKIFPNGPGETERLRRLTAILVLHNITLHRNAATHTTLQQHVGAGLGGDDRELEPVLKRLVEIGILTCDGDIYSFKRVPDPKQQIIAA